MGTEVGIHITNFLALHKDNSPVDPTLALGIKVRLIKYNSLLRRYGSMLLASGNSNLHADWDRSLAALLSFSQKTLTN